MRILFTLFTIVAATLIIEAQISLDEFESNLPIFLIETEENIPNEPKIMGKLKVIHSDDGVNRASSETLHYDGWIGIEERGNSTRRFPKKPYAMETRLENGDNRNVELLGLPAENDWTLRASYIDHTFIRNPLAMHLSQQTGRWASRCRHIELFINGTYQGIYILMEKIKRDKNRLDINRLNPDEITDPDITGGYLFEVSGFKDNFGKQRFLDIPDFEEAHPDQVDYIRNYDNAFRQVMQSSQFADTISGYHAWIDVAAFIDELLVQEAIRNSDAYGWSAYFYKDKNKKLAAGPVWDFDQSSGNSSYPDNGVVEGWMFEHPNTRNTPFFWSKLFTDPRFSFAVRQRWELLRAGPFATNRLIHFVDSIASHLDKAQQREFQTWPVLTANVWRETKGYQQRNTYEKEVTYLKNFLIDRWEWMDATLASIPNPDPTTSTIRFTQSLPKVFPNPANEYLYVEWHEPGAKHFQIFDSMGRLMQESYFNSLDRVITISLINLPIGVYTFRLFNNESLPQAGKFIVKR